MKFSRCFFIFVILCSAISILAQSETEKGIEFYNKGEFKQAIESLKQYVKKDKTDSIAHYYLGLSFEKTGESKEALKSFQKSTEIVYESFLKSLQKRNLANDKEKGAVDEILKQLSLKVEAGGLSALKLSQINPADFKLFGKLEKAYFVFNIYSKIKNGEALCESTSKIDKQMLITNKPRPSNYSISTGTPPNEDVTLFVIFDSSSKVILATPIKRASEGFTNSSIESAYKIGFQPAQKNQKPVSVCKQISYSRTSL